MVVHPWYAYHSGSLSALRVIYISMDNVYPDLDLQALILK